jgi:hypothetical protein
MERTMFTIILMMIATSSEGGASIVEQERSTKESKQSAAKTQYPAGQEIEIEGRGGIGMTNYSISPQKRTSTARGPGEAAAVEVQRAWMQGLVCQAVHIRP